MGLHIGAGIIIPHKQSAIVTYSIVLTGYNSANKVKVLREVTTASGLGLKEAKEIVEASEYTPQIVKSNLTYVDAMTLANPIVEVGGYVSIVGSNGVSEIYGGGGGEPIIPRYDLYLLGYGDSKLAVCGAIKTILNCSLTEAKKLVDKCDNATNGVYVVGKLEQAQAEEYRDMIVDAGGTAEYR